MARRTLKKMAAKADVFLFGAAAVRGWAVNRSKGAGASLLRVRPRSLFCVATTCQVQILLGNPAQTSYQLVACFAGCQKQRDGFRVNIPDSSLKVNQVFFQPNSHHHCLSASRKGMDLQISVRWAAVGLILCFPFHMAALCIYRLFLHPLAKYPGPKLAALSNWYELYYDVVQQGKFTFHIQELHKIYGK
jgi:hypothetical protein